jgi:hypothetical protein
VCSGSVFGDGISSRPHRPVPSNYPAQPPVFKYGSGRKFDVPRADICLSAATIPNRGRRRGRFESSWKQFRPHMITLAQEEIAGIKSSVRERFLQGRRADPGAVGSVHPLLSITRTCRPRVSFPAPTVPAHENRNANDDQLSEHQQERASYCQRKSSKHKNCSTKMHRSSRRQQAPSGGQPQPQRLKHIPGRSEAEQNAKPFHPC